MQGQCRIKDLARQGGWFGLIVFDQVFDRVFDQAR